MNKANLSIFLLFGLPLIAQYIWISTGKSGISSDKLWGHTPEEFRKFSYFSILISFLVGVYLFWYMCFKWETCKNVEWLAMVGLTLMIAASNFWIPSINSVGDNSVGNIITLTIVAIGALLLLISVTTDIQEDIYKKIAIFSSSWLLFQTVIMDAIVWNIYNVQN